MANGRPGPPTKYEPSHPERARRLALLGLTNDQIGDAFGIGEATFHEWREKHPEFDAAIDEGKIDADAKVAEALYRRAIGYRKKVTKVFSYEGDTFEHQIDEEVDPDVGAAAKWLHNRKPALWRVNRDLDDDEAPAPVRVVLEVVDARVRAEPESPAG
jgi:hypothetical protein